MSASKIYIVSHYLIIIATKNPKYNSRKKKILKTIRESDDLIKIIISIRSLLFSSSSFSFCVFNFYCKKTTEEDSFTL